MIQSLLIIVLALLVLKVLFSFKVEWQLVPFDDTRKELAKKYLWFNIAILLGFLLLIFINTAALIIVLSWLSGFDLTSNPTPQFFIEPASGPLFLGSLFLSFGGAFAITIKAVKLFKKELASEYWKFYNMNYGFNAAGAVKYMIIFLTLVSSVFIFLTMNSYVKFYSDSIEISQAYVFKAHNYSMEDVEHLHRYEKTIKNNKDTEVRSYYSITFKDGYIWYTTDGMRGLRNYDDLFDFLHKKTNLKIEFKEKDEG